MRPDELARHLDAILRAAGRLRIHSPDLWTIGWEPINTHPDSGQVDTDRRGKTDWTPRAGDPRARRLLDHLALVAARASLDLTGASAVMDRLLDARRPIYIPSDRGVLVSRPDLQAARDAQTRRRQRGEYSPVPLVEPPP